jgi:hypothetical protein
VTDHRLDRRTSSQVTLDRVGDAAFRIHPAGAAGFLFVAV